MRASAVTDLRSHLKQAAKLAADRAHRKQHEHLDAFIAVSGVRDLFSELQMRGAEVIKPLKKDAGPALIVTSRILTVTFSASVNRTPDVSVYRTQGRDDRSHRESDRGEA
jgi:hypothetical protein